MELAGIVRTKYRFQRILVFSFNPLIVQNLILLNIYGMRYAKNTFITVSFPHLMLFKRGFALLSMKYLLKQNMFVL